jgi:hypothetical protein
LILQPLRIFPAVEITPDQSLATGSGKKNHEENRMKLSTGSILPTLISLTALNSAMLFAATEDNATAQSAATPKQIAPQDAPAAQPVIPPQPANQAASGQITWLGVALGKVPPALSAHFDAIIPAGQGVLIEAVDPNSPAAKAGLQKHDILLAMGDQKLYSAQQLSSLVKAEKPGVTVTFQGVHQGELKSISVTLGEHSAPTPHHRWHRPRHHMMPPALPRGGRQQNLSWDSFESVEVKTLPDGHYHAEVAYKSENGEQKSFTFEGKREEIIKQIQEQKDLPAQKREALLSALNMRSDAIFDQPFFRDDIFNDPFFNGGFGADPFFQRSFPQLPDFGGFFRNPHAPGSHYPAPAPEDDKL